MGSIWHNCFCLVWNVSRKCIVFQDLDFWLDLDVLQDHKKAANSYLFCLVEESLMILQRIPSRTFSWYRYLHSVRVLRDNPFLSRLDVQNPLKAGLPAIVSVKDDQYWKYILFWNSHLRKKLDKLNCSQLCKFFQLNVSLSDWLNIRGILISS